jgi:hypothetical protein
MTFCPYMSRIGNTPEERKKFVENNLGFQLGEPVGHSAWLRPDDPDRMVAVFYNSCQGNYLDTGTSFFCMCVGGSERPYLELARRIENEDADPLLKSCYMVQYIGTNIKKCRHLFPDVPKERANEGTLMDCCWKRGGQQKEEILYYEQEVPGKSLQQCRLESKREICHVFRQLLDFAASLENSDRSLFDKYARILGSASLKETDGEPQLKFKVSLERTGYGDILDNRFASPPAPELWDAEHGGYFEKEQDALEHPKKLQTYGLGMLFGRLLLGGWLLDFPEGRMPLYRVGLDFEGLGHRSATGASPLESDSAFLEFLAAWRASHAPKTAALVTEEVVDEVLADRDFVRGWRSMLQYRAADRPTVAELLEAATWTPKVFAATLHPPEGPLGDESAVVVTGMGGGEIASCLLASHGSVASIRGAVAEKLGLHRREVKLALPSGRLLTEADDVRTLLERLD